ncbi:hypothetical protein ACM66B_005863 [Microbotryomycetes sp. NB124-2]
MQQLATRPSFVAQTPKRARTPSHDNSPAAVHVKRTTGKHDPVAEHQTVRAALSPFQATLQAHLAASPQHASQRNAASARTFTVLSAWKENLPVTRPLATRLSSSSSATSDEPSGSSARAQRRQRRCRVTFSDTPLTSARSSPRRRYHPYAHAPLSPCSVNLDPPPSSLPAHSSSSPVAQHGHYKHNCAHHMLERQRQASNDDGDTTTDDEADELAVEAMLLSQAQLAASPIRAKLQQTQSPNALITPTHQAVEPALVNLPPRSILKRRDSTTPVRLARTAAEGSLHNTRRKHNLNFAQDLQEAAAEHPNAPRTRPTNTGGRESSVASSQAAQLRSKATPSRSVTSRGNTQDNGDDEDEGDRRNRRPRGINDGRIVWNVRDVDPVNFESPLRTLRASLRPLSDAQTPRRDRSILPEMAPPFLVRHLSPNNSATASLEPPSSASKPFLPPSLGDIEAAYSRIVRTTVRLPDSLPSDAATFEPWRKYRQTFVQCIERDLVNVVNFAAWTQLQVTSREHRDSSPTPEQDGQTKATLSGEHLRRLKDEIAIAQVAIKACAALLSRQETMWLFDNAQIGVICKSILAVPKCSDASLLVRKDLFPFVSWFVETQTLPAPLIHSHMNGIIRALAICLSTRDKMRQNHDQGARAATSLIAQHPKQMLDQANVWFKPLFAGLWDTGKRGENVRARTLEALSEVAAVFGQGGDKRWPDDISDWKDSVSKQCLEMFHDCPVGAAEGITNLDVLVMQLKASVKSDRIPATDLTWANLHTFLAIIPILLGARFRRLNNRGITPHVELLNLFSEPSTPVRWHLLSGLAWNHAAYAFFVVPPSYSEGDTAPQPWLFQHGQKRLTVLFNIFAHRHLPAGPLKSDDKRSAMYEANALVVGHLLAGITAGVATLLREESDWPMNDKYLGHLDTFFDLAFAPELLRAVSCRLPDSRRLALAVLAAIVAPPTPSSNSFEALINTALFKGAIEKAGTPQSLQGLVQEAVSASAQPQDVASWGTTWIVSRVEKVVELLKRIGTDFDASDSDAMELVWANLFQVFSATDVSDKHLLSLLEGVNSALKVSTGPRQIALALRIFRHLRSILTMDDQIRGTSSQGVRARWQNVQTRAALADSTQTWSSTDLCTALIDARTLDFDLDVHHELIRRGSRLSETGRDSFELATETAKSWAHHWNVVHLSGDDLSDVANFVSAQTGSLREPCWKSLGEKLVDSIMLPSPAAPSVQETLKSMLTPPIDPSATIPFFSFLLRHSEHSTEEQQTELANLGTNCVYQLAAEPSAKTLRVVAEMLRDCTLKQLSVLYPLALNALDPSTLATHDDLTRVLPVLQQVARLTEGGYASPASFAAFVKLWTGTFDGKVEVPAALVDVLWLGQKLSAFEFEEGVGETQSISQPALARTESNESDAPLAAQKLGSVQTTVHASTSTAAPRASSDYDGEADVSRLESRSAPAASTSNIGSRLAVPASPSMHAPQQAPSTGKSPSVSVQEETPREVELARVRASLVNKSVPSESAADTSMRLQNPDIATQGDLSPSSEADSSRESSPAVSASLSIGQRRRGKSKKRARSGEARSQSSSPMPASLSDDGVLRSVKRHKGPKGSPIVSGAEETSPSLSPTTARNNEETIRSLLAMPVETVVRTAKRVGGSPGLHRFIELGEQAKRYFMARSKK